MGYFACFWRILFARRRLGVLVTASLGAMILNASLNALLMGPLGISGIALSTSSVTTVFALMLGIRVHREGLRVFRPGDWSFVFRVLAAAAVTGAAVLAWSSAFERCFSIATEPARLFEVAGGMALAALLYSAALQLQGIRAVPEALSRLVRTATDWRRG